MELRYSEDCCPDNLNELNQCILFRVISVDEVKLVPKEIKALVEYTEAKEMWVLSVKKGRKAPRVCLDQKGLRDQK